MSGNYRLSTLSFRAHPSHECRDHPWKRFRILQGAAGRSCLSPVIFLQVNLYACAFNNPSRFRDPFGLSATVHGLRGASEPAPIDCMDSSPPGTPGCGGVAPDDPEADRDNNDRYPGWCLGENGNSIARWAHHQQADPRGGNYHIGYRPRRFACGARHLSLRAIGVARCEACIRWLHRTGSPRMIGTEFMR